MTNDDYMAMMSVNVMVEIDEVRVRSYKSFDGKAQTHLRLPYISMIGNASGEKVSCFRESDLME